MFGCSAPRPTDLGLQNGKLRPCPAAPACISSEAGTPEAQRIDPLPAKIYANEGACQFLFLQGNEPCEISYADRAGKYMGQKGVTLPKL